ncbi:MAG: FAD-dependent oxidoreductase [Bacteroidota bacterium]
MQHLTRRDVLKLLGTLGLALPASSVLMGCDSNRTPFDGEVLIVGSGAAGMASGYLLAQAGLPFRILEASPRYGGRMKSTDSFVDFPIPLGAEWLHVSPDELRATVNDSSVEITTQTIPYQPDDTFGYAENGTYEVVELTDGDRKFVGTTWLDFFKAYIVPSVESAMQFETEIVTVDYQTDRVVLTDRAGATYEADKVIVTVPMKILQQGRVTFAPELPARMQRAIRDANIWSGIKVFLEFREPFYPTFLGFPDSMTDRG